MCVCDVLSLVQIFVTPWTVALQALLWPLGEAGGRVYGIFLYYFCNLMLIYTGLKILSFLKTQIPI